MGILAEPMQFLRELKLPRDFWVCELGNQMITGEPGEAYDARKFYVKLGCGRYESIDGNGRGTYTHDLNLPLPGNWGQGKFALVTDFGTGEHVFSQLQVWKTIHHLCRADGVIVFDRPSAGYEDHGFYLIQWNLVTALAHANWYEVLWLEEKATTRGVLLRGALRKRREQAFVTPQQGRYHADLRAIMGSKQRVAGPDWKSKELRAAGAARPRAQR